MGDPMVTSRDAADGDRSVIDALGTLALDELRDQRGGLLLFDFDRADTGHVVQDEAAVYAVVGEIDRIVVGYGLCRVVGTGGLRVATLEDLYVHGEARGVGVGAAMLHRVRDWARGQGCTHLESQVLPGNRDAKNFFERMGMVTRRMQVSTSL